MRYVWDNDLHIHSKISLCSDDPEQTPERILEYAKENGLKNIVLTDHFWDKSVKVDINWYEGEDFDHGYDRVKQALPLPQADGINFYFGCETELDRNFTLGIAKESFDKFDFVVIPTTHLHMLGFTIDRKDYAVENRARVWVERLEAVLNMDLPFHKIGLAHLTTPLCTPIAENAFTLEDYKRFLDLLPQEKLVELFTKASRLGVGIELNFGSVIENDEVRPSIMRIYRTAKECGCKFYFASDAHHPAAFSTRKAVFEFVIDELQLTEDDKFYIKK